MLTIADIRRLNLESLIAEAGGLTRLAESVGSDPVYLSQLRRQAPDHKTGRTRAMGSALARRLELACGRPAGWMDAAHAVSSSGQNAGPVGAAVRVLEPATGYDAPLVAWGEPVWKDGGPRIFRVEMPDDSMAPRVRRGDIVRFSRDEQARPGDGVLVRAASGELFFRVFRHVRPGAWDAYPLNEAFSPLQSERDELSVVAVLIGIDRQRWG